MSDLPEIVKRAAGLHVAITADLSVFGGVVRCGTCGREEPADDIAGHVRSGWPKCCGLTMTWVTRKQLLAEQWEVPEGHELAAVISENWRIETGKLCSRRLGRTTCRKPSAASLNRGCRRWSAALDTYREWDAWHPYCLEHLYGNWIEHGVVMHWILREKASSDG